MTTFTDGPAAGQVLLLGRAPLFLRVVCDKEGRWDALDRHNDKPEAGEEGYAYRRVGKAGVIHIDFGRPRRALWLATATYELVQPQPPAATMQGTELWRAWCTDQAAQQQGGKKP